VSRRVVIPLNVSGLTKPDFGLRFYRNGVADVVTVAALTVTEIGAGDYVVNGMPDEGSGAWYTLTWEYPPGAGSSFVYPQQEGAPPNVVVPLREGGLLAA
jgi:hypothetical protein